MVVHDDDPRCGFGDGGAEDFPRVDERAVEQPAGDEDVSQDLALAIQREEVKLFDSEIAQARLEEADDVLRLANARQRRATLTRESGGELERRDQTSGLAGPDAREAHQLGGGPGREPAQRAVGGLENAGRDIDDVQAAPAGAQNDGEQFGQRERGWAERPQAFPGALTHGKAGEGSGHRRNIG